MFVFSWKAERTGDGSVHQPSHLTEPSSTCPKIQTIPADQEFVAQGATRCIVIPDAQSTSAQELPRWGNANLRPTSEVEEFPGANMTIVVKIGAEPQRAMRYLDLLALLKKDE